MQKWSLPPSFPTQPAAHDIEELFGHWSPSRAWQWLRYGRIPLDSPKILDRIAVRVFADLGVMGDRLNSAWHMRHRPLVDPWQVPTLALPVTPSEPWPDQAASLEGTPEGLLAVVLANGWNPFKPFLHQPVKEWEPQGELHPMWGIETLMGHVGETRIEPLWRWALLHQMARSPHCPSVGELDRREVCRRKKAKSMRWVPATIHYRDALAFRACVELGLSVQLQLSPEQRNSVAVDEATLLRCSPQKSEDELFESAMAWESSPLPSERPWWKALWLQQCWTAEPSVSRGRKPRL